MNELIGDILKSLKEFKDTKRIDYAEKSYPTKMELIGVTVPNLKIVLKELKKQTKLFSVSDRMELTKKLIDIDIFECQQLAYEYLGNDKNVLKTLSEKDIDDLGKNLDNWLSVDYYAALIVGYAWRENIITIEKVKKFLDSDNFWIRRIAIVATISLNQKARGGTGDSKRTLDICKLVIDDHEDMINKALSWALRELAKVDKESVIKFVEQYRDRLNKKVLREVTNKLEIGTKN